MHLLPVLGHSLSLAPSVVRSRFPMGANPRSPTITPCIVPSCQAQSVCCASKHTGRLAGERLWRFSLSSPLYWTHGGQNVLLAVCLLNPFEILLTFGRCSPENTS